MKDYRRRWLALRRSIRTEAELAEKNYGVKLLPRTHADLIDQNRRRAEVLRKLLREDQ
jgi:hypothetical protein